MAVRNAQATGNWSSASVFPVAPVAGDDVYANGFTVTIDQDVTVNSINTTAGSGGVAGGGFTVSSGNRTINANIVAGSTACLTISGASLTTTINGTVTGSATTGTTQAVNITGSSGTTTITGAVTGGTPGSGGSAHGVRLVTGSGMTLNVTGNVTGGASASNNCHGISVESTNVTVSVTGDVKGAQSGAGTTNTGITSISAGSAITVAGNIQGGTTTSNHGISYNAGGSLTVSGNNRSITGGTGSSATGVTTATSQTDITMTGTGCTVAAPNSTSTNGSAIVSGAPNSVLNITATFSGGLGGNTGLAVSITANGQTATLTGSVTAGTGGGVSFSGNTGTVNIVGNVTGGTAGTSNAYGARNTGTGGTLNITGDVATGTNGHGVINSSSGTVNITGNVTNVATTGSNFGVDASGAGNITITGNVTGGNQAAVSNCYGVDWLSTGTLVVTGTATGGIGVSAYGVFINAIATAARVGVAKGNDYPNSSIVNAVPGVYISQNTQFCTLDSMEDGSGGISGRSSTGKWFIRDAASPNYVKMRQSNAGSITTMSDTNVPVDYPTAANVRSGTTYNFGSQTGTLAVPLPSQVEIGVSTDNTTGTAALTPANIWNAATATYGSAGSYGELLENKLDATVSSRSTYAGADTAGTTTLLSRIASAITITGGKVDVNDKTGFALSAGGVQAIWDALTSALTTVGSIGKWILDKLDVAVSTRNSTAPDNASITAIKAKTDNLPAAPASTGDVTTVGTAVAAVKAKTDLLDTTRLANVATTDQVGDIVDPP